MRKARVVLTTATIALLVRGEIRAQEPGFIGEVVVEWVEGVGPDRDMRLLQPFAYRSADGVLWEVPAGAVVNGASIPRILWTTVGPPFVGDYRRASVVHDYFCGVRSWPWLAVHRMFHEASIAGGVSEAKASRMYMAVWALGPRWQRVHTSTLTGRVPDMIWDVSPPGISEEDFDVLSEWIELENPSLEAIEERVMQVRG